MSDDKRLVRIDANLGPLLAEVSRAYLHQATPSAFLSRLLSGIAQFATQTDEETKTNIAGVLYPEIAALHDKWKKLEDNEFNQL